MHRCSIDPLMGTIVGTCKTFMSILIHKVNGWNSVDSIERNNWNLLSLMEESGFKISDWSEMTNFPSVGCVLCSQHPENRMQIIRRMVICRYCRRRMKNADNLLCCEEEDNPRIEVEAETRVSRSTRTTKEALRAATSRANAAPRTPKPVKLNFCTQTFTSS